MNVRSNENYNKLLEISNALKESGWNIASINFNRHLITVERFFATVEIYADIYEQRVSLVELNHSGCNYYLDIRKEDMTSTILKLINEFRHENFKLGILNQFGYGCDGHDKVDYHYYPNDKSMLRFLLGEETEENIYSIQEFSHQYPNPAMKQIVKKLDKKSADEVRKNRYFISGKAIIFEIHHIEYKQEKDGFGYKTKVLDEIKEERIYYAFVEIRED